MKRISNIVLLIGVVSIVAGAIALAAKGAASLEPKRVTTNTEKESQELGDHVIKLMTIVQPSLSDARKQMLTRTFVRVANDILKDQEQRKNFAILISIESHWNPDAQNPGSGATGLGQLMPAYAPGFGQICKIPRFTNEDLKDPELNLTMSACIYRRLVEIYKNNAAALVAYNAGGASLSMRQLISLKNITNSETSNYISRFLYIQEELKK